MRRLRLRVGTCGWSYPDWVGPFYPRGTEPGAMLRAYARVFDAVEVNSTFYATPPRERVEAWARDVPESFVFTVKAPQELTHDARLRLGPDTRRLIESFAHALEPLGSHLDAVLLQLPRSLTREEGLGHLADLLMEEPFPVPLAIEARHASWFVPQVYDLLRRHRVTWVWSENEDVATPPESTSSSAYLRFVGERVPGRVGHLRREPEPVMRHRWEVLESRRDEGLDVKVFANNHFAGFAPGAVNAFLKIAGQEPRKWSAVPGAGGQAGLERFGL